MNVGATGNREKHASVYACIAYRRRRNLSDVAGTWDSDATVEEVLAAQDEPDPNLWR